MTQKSNALRLADLLETYPLNECDEEAAAELRRLHEELAVTERQVEILSDDLSRCSKMNAELLEALKETDVAWVAGRRLSYAQMVKVRAAIAKAEGEHT